MAEEQMADEVYDLINNGNNVTAEDLKNFIETVFSNTTIQQAEQILQPLGNVVTRSEFSTILGSLVRKRATNLEVFNSWDRDRKGYISRKDIDMMLKSYGLSFKDSYVDHMMNYLGDGNIDFEQFDRLLNEMESACKEQNDIIQPVRGRELNGKQVFSKF